ncbi:PQQ-binding-like beta-propeller repeat protein [Nonomuraea sp. B10E15]|uniref:PQQ-binding-like beta-propeller repeat protein n=1 Tax=Nonomuraea sp. B10E15 TaxID=3153560 RepID=UPI00325CCAC5
MVDDLLLATDFGLMARDAASGRLLWQADERSGDHTYALLNVHPTIAEDMLLVTEGYEPHRHEDSGVHAFDLRTGALRWEIWGDDEPACAQIPPCANPDAVLVMGPPVWARGLVWIRHYRVHGADLPDETKLVGLDLRTGRPQRTLALEGVDDYLEPHIGAPIFGPDLAYCQADKRIDALDLVTGTVRWSRRLATSMVGAPLLAGDVLHVATENGGLHAFDAGTGDPRWSIALEETTTWSAADFLYKLGEVAGYDEVAAPFVLTDGHLFARTDNAVLMLR